MSPVFAVQESNEFLADLAFHGIRHPFITSSETQGFRSAFLALSCCGLGDFSVSELAGLRFGVVGPELSPGFD